MGAFGAGKVILFGEHAVVYGEPALAAALDVGIGVSTVRRADRPRVRVARWETVTARDDPTRQGESLDAILTALEAHLGHVDPVEIVLDVGLPTGAGLGSSAALAVCTARAFIEASAADLAPRAKMELVLAAAAASEAVFHGSASGVDHTTSARGGILRYQRDPTTAEASMRSVDSVPAFSLVIAQMEAGADTRTMVRGVAALRTAYPSFVPTLTELLGSLTDTAIAALRRGDWATVGELMNLAHGALMSLGVSTAALDAGCHVAREAGALGAKLTGAGGGGCLIALPPPHGADRLAAVLRQAGALEVLTTTLGSP